MANPDRRVSATTKWACAWAAVGLVAGGPVAFAQQPNVVSGVNAEQLFVMAGQLEGGERESDAERIYVALEGDNRPEIRNEARFRHAQLLQGRHELDKAASLYRAILAEQPGAQRVRIELAAVLAQAGDLSGAEHELSAMQAGGLPPDIARLVDQYAAALRSSRPFGASFEFALAPSNNINRARS